MGYRSMLVALSVAGALGLAGALGASPTSTAAAGPVVSGEPIGGPQLGRSGVVTDLPAGVPAPPTLPAGAYLLADLDSGDVLLSVNAHAKGLPASTMKTLTALALVPRLKPSTVVTAAPEDAAVDGTKVGIDPGAPYTVGQLFSSLLMVSANDSAVALARANGGLAPTLAQMNEVAARLGARDTVAKNTSGLDATGQTTSAYDLALIGRAALADPAIATYVATKTAPFPGGRTKQGQKREQWQLGNHNRLLWNYAGAVGVKNGYTVKAGQTYIGAARRNGRTYIFTYLNSTDANWRTVASFFDWAFTYGSKAKAVGTLNGAAAGTSPTAAPSGSAASAAAAAVALQHEGLAGPDFVRAVGVSAAVGVGVTAAAVAALRIRVVRRRRAHR